MNSEDIIRMAHEAQFEGFGNGDWVCTTEEIERFAKLVRDDYSNKHANLWLDRCHAYMLEEREACAKVCENMAKGYEERSARPEKDRDINPEVARIAVMTCGFVEAAIRARGNT